MSHRLILMHTNMLTKNTRLEKEEAPLIYPPPHANLRGKRRRGSKRRGCEEEEEMLGEEGREEKDVCHSEWQNTTVVFLYMLYVIYVYICVCVYIYICINMASVAYCCVLNSTMCNRMQAHGQRRRECCVLCTITYVEGGEGDEKGGAICT